MVNWLAEHLGGFISVLWRKRAPTSTENNYLDFVKSFNRKECIWFMPVSGEEPPSGNCYCGLPKEKHVNPNDLVRENLTPRSPSEQSFFSLSVSALTGSSNSTRVASRESNQYGSVRSESRPYSHSAFEEWTPIECLQEFPTNAYGRIYFTNIKLGESLPVHYLKLSDDSRISFKIGVSEPEVLRLFEDYWHLLEPARPHLVISIAGDTQASNIDVSKSNAFMSGVIKAVKSTNAWLLTDGMDTGYTRLVGKTVRKAQSLVEHNGHAVTQIKCIGVVPYGRISDSASFESKNGKFNICCYESDKAPTLNSDHTHFLFVDNGFYNEKSNVDNFRSRLLDSIQERSPFGLGIPVVVLVLNGGVSAIRECLMALRRETPVLIVGGTGRAADLLAYAVTRYSMPMIREGKVVVTNPVEDDHLQDILQQVPHYLPDLDSDKYEECARDVAECCEMGSLITVFNIGSDSSMDKHILYALLTGRATLLDQLELALQWDRADIAEEKIFPQFENSDVEADVLDRIMAKAILDQKDDFIELLLQKDMVMTNFLSITRLRVFYNQAKADSHLRTLLKKCGEEEIYLSDVHILLKKLVGKHMHELYITDVFDNGSEYEKARFEDPYLELMIWSVLSRRGQLAVYLWKKCKSPLHSSLLATSLYRALQDSLSVRDNNLREEYGKMRNIFEQKAVKLLDNCYRDDRAKALNLVEQRSTRWGDLHLLDFALMAKDMLFISSVCCQNSVEQRWKNIKSKFWLRLVYRIVIMLMHIYLVLFHMVYSPSMMEIVLCALIISDALEKLLELTFAKSYRLWLSAWNIYDIFTQVVFLAGFAFRLSPTTFYMGKILYGCCAMLFCCRLFRVYYIHTRLGPMILIFIYMIPKLFEFVSFLVVLLVGYGITSKALMNHPCETREALSNFSDYMQFAEDIIFTPYWQMFGELPLEEIETRNWKLCQNWTWNWYWGTSCEMCKEGPDNPACVCQTSNQEERFATKLMLAIYLIIGNVLLLNLVIAIFTNLFDQVQRKSSEHWKFEMYRLIREYERRPALPPPIGPFIYMWRIWKRICSPTNGMAKPVITEKDKMLAIFEQQEAQTEPADRRNTPSDDMTEFSRRLKHVEETLEHMKHKIDKLHEARAADDAVYGEHFLKTLERYMAPFEKLVGLPSKINILEGHLRASQMRLEEEQAVQGQDLKALKTVIGNLTPSLGQKKDKKEEAKLEY